MVGTMLSRVFSRTKIMARIEQTPIQNDHHQSNMATQQLTSTQKTTTIAFGDDVKSVASKNPATHVGHRKHSYASVKEDPELPQSFLTRRPHDESQKSTDSVASDVQCSWQNLNQDDDETVIVDDYDEDEVAMYSDSDTDSTSSRGTAALENMPEEILGLIFSYVTLDLSKDRYADPKVDLFNLLFVSRTIHAAALRVLYRHVKVPQSKAFFKFHNALLADAHLGTLVQCLDFSHFSSIGFGRARSVTVEKPYLTPQTLAACLEKTTNLKAFLVHEHVDDELDAAVLSKLCNITTLRALDLCGSASKTFVQGFTEVCLSSSEPLDNIERLSLHECSTLQPQVFEALMPRLTRLTHLDVAHTMVNDKALMSIPSTARLTHLNLERCTQLTGSTVVNFLMTHPAARTSMTYLNLLADASRYRLLSESDLDTLLPALPSTLRSLNLGGSRINASHARALRRLATHLEELGLKGANLSLSQDVAHILSLPSGDCDEELEHPEWAHSLRYLDLTDVKAVNQMSLTYSPTSITAAHSSSLEVIELGDSILQDINKRIKNAKNPDWVVRELGRRGWYVRQATDSLDDGYRTWKMGAKWWGMRKIPMFEQETGGMYGYFMFKRA